MKSDGTGINGTETIKEPLGTSIKFLSSTGRYVEKNMYINNADQNLLDLDILVFDINKIGTPIDT